MMGTVAIACKTIEDEVMKAARAAQTDIPVIWVESGLHIYPEKLGQRLQQEIDKIDHVDNILLGFGSCGNCLLGLVSPKARLIIPHVADCISLLLGGDDPRQKLQKQGASYFLTRGWLRNEANILKEYAACIKKYGEKRSLRVFQTMLAHYQNLSLIDTGAFSLDDIMEETREFAAKLDLNHQVLPGTLDILYRAFRMEWERDFLIIEPGQVIDLQALGAIGEPNPQLQSLEHA
jgi:hypothetical protein